MTSTGRREVTEAATAVRAVGVAEEPVIVKAEDGGVCPEDRGVGPVPTSMGTTEATEAAGTTDDGG